MVTIIAAIQEKDNGLGYQNDLLMQIPEDMKRFVKLTNNNAVIMGRKTWESIPEKYRPLKNRVNVVITRNKNYQVPKGVYLFNNIEEAIEAMTLSDREIFIIGGGDIYKDSMRHADRLLLTIISSNKPADVYFPDWKRSLGNIISMSEDYFCPKNKVNFYFLEARKQKTHAKA